MLSTTTKEPGKATHSLAVRCKRAWLIHYKPRAMNALAVVGLFAGAAVVQRLAADGRGYFAVLVFFGFAHVIFQMHLGRRENRSTEWVIEPNYVPLLEHEGYDAGMRALVRSEWHAIDVECSQKPDPERRRELDTRMYGSAPAQW